MVLPSMQTLIKGQVVQAGGGTWSVLRLRGRAMVCPSHTIERNGVLGRSPTTTLWSTSVNVGECPLPAVEANGILADMDVAPPSGCLRGAASSVLSDDPAASRDLKSLGGNPC